MYILHPKTHLSFLNESFGTKNNFSPKLTILAPKLTIGCPRSIVNWSNEIHFTVTWKCFIIYHLKDATLNAFYFRTGSKISSAGSPKFPNSSKRTSMFIPLRFYYLQLWLHRNRFFKMVYYTLTSPVNLPESANYLYFVVNFGQQGQQKKGYWWNSIFQGRESGQKVVRTAQNQI